MPPKDNYETMIMIPSKVISDKCQTILFAVKYFNKKAQSLVSPSNLETSGASINFTANSGQNSYDCNMDQFITKMSRDGQILFSKTSHLKSVNSGLLTFSAASGKHGLLLDLNDAKQVNIFEYVHSNDHNHINQHISNGMSCEFCFDYSAGFVSSFNHLENKLFLFYFITYGKIMQSHYRENQLS